MKTATDWLHECRKFIAQEERWGLFLWRNSLVEWLQTQGKTNDAERVRRARIEFQEDTDLEWAHNKATEELRCVADILEICCQTAPTPPCIAHQQDEGTDMDTGPRIFLSYSWDFQNHKDWVRKLADRLISDGLEVILDQYDLRGGQDMHVFMERGVCDASHVLVVCTSQYVSRANRRQRGVGEETSLITPEFYDRQRSGKEFIPIIRSHGDGKSTPDYLSSLVYVDFSDDARFETSYEELLRIIYNEPSLKKPPRGQKPSFAVPPTAHSVEPRPTSVASLHARVVRSSPEDWNYDDDRGVYTYKLDALLQIRQVRKEEPEAFQEGWAQAFPDPAAYLDIYELYYNNNLIEDYFFVAVDGYRMSLPLPHSADDLRIEKDRYEIGRIVNGKQGGHDFDEYITRAGIQVIDNKP